MRKILPILIVGVLILNINTASAIFPNNSEHQGKTRIHPKILQIFDGSFTGYYGIMNETDEFETLGYINGQYLGAIRLFVGQINSTDDSFICDIIGLFGDHIFVVLFKFCIAEKIQIGVGIPAIGPCSLNTTTQEFEGQISRINNPDLLFYGQFHPYEE